MLNHLLGSVFSLKENLLVVDIGGIGITVLISRKLREDIENNEKEKVFLYTRLIGRDGDYIVYGFYNEQERILFDHLLQVQGVGAKSAILLLSELSGRDIFHAVRNEKSEILSSVKGIGSKVANRIVLELKNKIDSIWSYELREQMVEGYKDLDSTLIEKAVQALIHLGCRRGKAQMVVEKALINTGREVILEDLIKESLRKYNE